MARHSRDAANPDERLARFADQVIAGEIPEGAQPDSLQKTVKQLGRTLKPERPETAMAERIWNNLAVEWRKSGLEARKATRKWRSGRQAQRATIIRLAVALACILIVALLLTPTLETFLPGAAGKTNIPIIFLGIAFVILIVSIFWRGRHDG